MCNNKFSVSFVFHALFTSGTCKMVLSFNKRVYMNRLYVFSLWLVNLLPVYLPEFDIIDTQQYGMDTSVTKLEITQTNYK